MSDCGLFAKAYVNTLAFKGDPSQAKYNQKANVQICSSMLHCKKNGTISIGIINFLQIQY